MAGGEACEECVLISHLECGIREARALWCLCPTDKILRDLIKEIFGRV